ncbi:MULTISPECIES: carbohydrate ABC transporter permease [unclassified Curtobacterium]|uniref:carbohydrate ABC transporter permease n=1 Tax=unclassified Curtobacterium TaxID=257496 RepID=UPI000DAA782B|nr:MULTISPECIES: carbohydrate ABC transporter permease [unclassified Curtobacterium]PZE23251.1 carbohydrate ABC transporter permease [Curtobacterium sp. MCBD17_028]PZE72856.1 carbohydrate ABC transporter permease [Curtobacterium sp. MCBD17_019]PZF59060.1 carbohydrate ABC transporter permease [Curtobacterium sp. MCBD17_013]WIB63113.1 carbohydrate ABC transporter permease [Curtobacterium sp. MCBD17_040]WIB66964.1 carbohydrate ABC transporter permease [Curtobacterium sp. MCBD17_035]
MAIASVRDTAVGGSTTTRTNGAGRPRRTRANRNVVGAVAAWVWLAVVLLPIYYVVITSITAQGSYYTRNPLAPPTHPTLASYALVLQSGFGVYFANSVIVSLVTVVVTTAVCLLAAYAIVRSRRWIVRSTYSLFLLGLAIPLQATVIPLFFVLGRVGLYDTLAAVILPSIAFAIPITVLILVNFIRDIPGELFEAMRVDGAGQWAILWRLVLPLSRSSIATVAIYDALQVWNGFLLPLVLTQSDDKRVLPLALWNFQGQFSINVPATLAAVVLSALPILVLYLLARRQLVAGLTMGAGK